MLPMKKIAPPGNGRMAALEAHLKAKR